MTSPQDHDLQRCLIALREGDQAFLTTLVLRHGGHIARVLGDAGAPADHLEALVHKVAFAAADRIHTQDALAPWEFVLTVVAGVLDDTLGGPDDDPATQPGASSDPLDRGASSPTGPGLHLVDLGNPVCGPSADRHQMLAAWRFYRHVAAVRPDPTSCAGMRHSAGARTAP